jgi:hypothetical protein
MHRELSFNTWMTQKATKSECVKELGKWIDPTIPQLDIVMFDSSGASMNRKRYLFFQDLPLNLLHTVTPVKYLQLSIRLWTGMWNTSIRMRSKPVMT